MRTDTEHADQRRTKRFVLDLTRIERSAMPYKYDAKPTRREGYAGRIADWTESQARQAQQELLDYFGHADGPAMTPPPLGFPGHNDWAYEEVIEVINLGVQYYAAWGSERPARQWKIHDRIQEIMRDLYHRGANDRQLKIDTERADKWTAKDKRVKELQRNSVVYFIAGEEGPIKIGVAVDPQKRLSGLQTSHHQKLAILATKRGNYRLERDYHKRFAEHRLHGEWFARAPAIVDEIQRLGGAA